MNDVSVPLRVDFAGGWLDVPKFAREDGFIVNVAIKPLVTKEYWPYEKNSGLGGSAAYSLLCGNNAVETELGNGVGWQDPAVLMETGLCAWRSGPLPRLWIKRSPDMLEGKMAIYWTGKPHVTADLVDMKRDYKRIHIAGCQAAQAVSDNSFRHLCTAVRETYGVQLNEGMDALPYFGEIACKYVGGGHGGYAVYLFDNRPSIPVLMPIEPYIKCLPKPDDRS